ncbi:transporter substrate-binding domain-containing protein [Simiduia curdlanivorans]|uniref:Substrate-binding periplasmic protein n=1 Tax=Simiduia curdlanivorans TaxID=1492769 RepID=A0ABV8V2E5_9GAMM|nr:transporter substrate-binding domain-containing protein [Simiduia curdlanivorans]MDN3637859.1 transporter substrate-binding domain-containing protein [Simiduia curdlanivorans]
MRHTILTWALCAFISAPTLAQTSLEGHFVAPRVPLHLELDKSGFLIAMHQWLMARAVVQSDLTVVPGGRATAMFEAEKVDGLYPSWISAKYKVNALYTAPFMQVDHFIYSKPGAAAFSKLADLKGRRLGLIQHYQLQLDFAAQEDLFITYARNSQTLMTLLLSGRVDAVILSDIEVNALQKAMQIEALSVDPSAVLLTKHLGYVLHDNAKGRALHERINAAIVEAQNTGALSAYLNNAVQGFK